jgi:hypothetical protein
VFARVAEQMTGLLEPSFGAACLGLVWGAWFGLARLARRDYPTLCAWMVLSFATSLALSFNLGRAAAVGAELAGAALAAIPLAALALRREHQLERSQPEGG